MRDSVIEFQLDETSGVATYLQLVQQVHQALRLGMLEPGDRLPTAQQVVAQLAINPNTVLKAYRELEREGLVRARPGLGTFVTRCRRTDPPIQARFLAELADWLPIGARGGPGPRRHRGDLPHRHPRLLRRGGRMTAVIEADGLGKRYRRRWALRDCTLAIPEGQVVGLVGPNGAGKTTLLQLAVGLLVPTSRHDRRPRRAPAAGPGELARVGFVAQDTAVYARLTVADHLRLGAWLNPRWDDDMAEDRIDQLDLDPEAAGRVAVRW